MFKVHIGLEKGACVATCEQSTKLDVAKEKADFVAGDMPDIILVTVRHHRTGETLYTVRGKIEA